MKKENEADRIAKDIVATAKGLGISVTELEELVENRVASIVEVDQEKEWVAKTASIRTKLHAAEWLAKEAALANPERWIDEDDLERDVPTAKDFLEDKKLRDDYIRDLLDFDAEDLYEKAFQKLVAKVRDTMKE